MPTTHTFNRVDTKRPKNGRNPVWEPRFQADFGRGKVRHEGGVRLHEMAGGQSSAKCLPSDYARTYPPRARVTKNVSLKRTPPRRCRRATRLRAFELDWRIWEASRGGSLPYPTAPA